MSSTVAFNTYRAGCLRSVGFDSTYLVGTTALAVASGWLVVSSPFLFPIAFLLNAWLLGYHHVISTFTRLTFDSDSLKRHCFLVTWLPIFVLAATALACVTIGTWMLTTIYFYWQWWHYTRQSYGISRMYQRKAGLKDDLLHKLVIYALPVSGILYRSWQAPDQFLFTKVRVVPVPLWLAAAVGFAALIAIGWWTVQTIRNWFLGSLAASHTLYLCSHLLIFGLGYLLINNINHGWLVATVWHNCQYILTVWMFNNNRFKDAVDPQHRFLSFISQRRRVLTYAGVCLLLSTVTYTVVQYSLAWIAIATATSVPLVAIAFQTLNFHHYLVDALIWRRAAVSSQAGIG